MLRLFHSGNLEINSPDIHHGRTNADFGQGFYTSDDEAFSRRWAGERKDVGTYINCYELDTSGLNIKRFTRNREWFEYIYRNRTARPDEPKQFDVIMGPIANDTIYDTWGITTSGLLAPDEAVKLLMIGPEFTQIVIKTDRAAANLKWISSRRMDPEEIRENQSIIKTEEEKFQELFAVTLKAIIDGE